jgi:hypothetical protein
MLHHRLLRQTYLSLWTGRRRNRGSILSRGKRLYSSTQHRDRIWGSSTLVSNGYRGSFSAETWGWPSLPSSAKVENTSSHTSTPPYVFIAWCLTTLLSFTGAAALCEYWPSPWFRKSKFFLGEVVAPSQNPNLEDQKLHFVWPLPFDLSGMGDPTRSLRSRQHSSPGHWEAQTSPPAHDKAVVTEVA